MYILISIIILIFITYKYNYKHLFWDKQPVSRNLCNKEGIISKNPIFNIHLQKYMYFKYLNKLDTKIFDFINNHFTDYYQYSNEFLKNTLNYLDNLKIYNIALYEASKLIGFIHAKPIKLYINNIFIDIYYVDFLCVHKKYRKKNIASLLISKLINSCNSKQIFIFKKENKQLPFNYINKSSYYYLHINSVKNINKKIDNIKFSNLEDIEDIYCFINKIYKTKKIYNYLDIIQFKNLYINSNKKILIEYDLCNKIIAIIIFIEIKFNYNHVIFKTYDIENIYINGIKNYKILDYLIIDCKNNNIDMISCLNQSYNKYFIDKYNMKKGMTIYFHMYNYHLNKKIDNFNLLFNVL